MHLSNYIYIHCWIMYVNGLNELHTILFMCIYENVNGYVIPLVILNIKRSMVNAKHFNTVEWLFSSATFLFYQHKSKSFSLLVQIL